MCCYWPKAILTEAGNVALVEYGLRPKIDTLLPSPGAFQATGTNDLRPNFNRIKLLKILFLTAFCSWLGVSPVVAERVPEQKPEPDAPATAQTTPDEEQTKADDDGAPELTAMAAQAIDKGLKFLLSAQKEDGSWASENGGRAIAGTSLVLMAFMVKGQFPGFGRHADALDRAKDFLLKKAKESDSGFLGGTMYEHGLATLAFSELWGMTRKPQDNKDIQKVLEAAVKVILRSQNSGGGWRYQPRPNFGQDTSVTAMVFVALASARQAGIEVPSETIERVVGYLRDEVRVESSGGFAYGPGSGPTTACTAGGAYAAQLCGQRETEWVSAALRSLERAPGVFTPSKQKHFYYVHYYAIQAMVQAGDEQYAKWYQQIRDSLIKMQNPDGSWGGGESPHMTPMAIIILGTPHRFIPIYQR